MTKSPKSDQVASPKIQAVAWRQGDEAKEIVKALTTLTDEADRNDPYKQAKEVVDLGVEMGLRVEPSESTERDPPTSST